MKLLLDTHVILWAAADSNRLTVAARQLIGDAGNEKFFSVASLWEVAIKRGLGRADFQCDPAELRQGLLDNAYVELPVLGSHAMAVANLPPIHKDPFDRMLVAQARVEGLALLTADPIMAQYGVPVRQV